MLCESAERPPRGREWRYELKLDGFRAIGRKAGRTAQLWARNQKDFTRRFPHVVKGIAELANGTVGRRNRASTNGKGMQLAVIVRTLDEMYTDNSRIMTVKEVSAYLHLSTSTVYRALKHGQLPAFKIGSDWRFNVETIDRWRLEQEGPRFKFGR
jgi:excisionase family DNA binding protein